MSKVYVNEKIFPTTAFKSKEDAKNALKLEYNLDNLMLIAFFTEATSSYIENLEKTTNIDETKLRISKPPFHAIKRLEADLKIKNIKWVDDEEYKEAYAFFVFTSNKYKVWREVYGETIQEILVEDFCIGDYEGDYEMQPFEKKSTRGKYSENILYYIISKDNFDNTGYRKFYYDGWGARRGILLSSQLIKEAEGEDCLKIINPEYYMEDFYFSKQNIFNIPPLILADYNPKPFTFIKKFSFSIFDIEGGN